MTDQLLTPQQVAERLQVSIRTLHNWRKTGRGPRAIVQGKWVRYQAHDIDRWLAESSEQKEAG